MTRPLDALVGDPRDGHYPYWRLVLRGCSQLCFQSNEITGLFFIAAVFAASPITAAYFVVAAVAAPAGRMLLGAKDSTLATGLPGLNPSLIAISLPSFYATAWTDVGMWGVLLVCIAVAIVLVHVLVAILPFPILIIPFLAIFWGLGALEPYLDVLRPLSAPAATASAAFDPFSALVLSLGEAVFSPTLLSGAFFFVGVLASSWRCAIIAVLGAAVGSGVAQFYSGVDVVDVDHGLYGFNGVLAGVAAYVVVGGGVRLAVLSALAATILIPVVSQFGVPSLSAPFAMTIWIVLVLGWVDRHWFKPQSPPSDGPKPD